MSCFSLSYVGKVAGPHTFYGGGLTAPTPSHAILVAIPKGNLGCGPVTDLVSQIPTSIQSLHTK